MLDLIFPLSIAFPYNILLIRQNKIRTIGLTKSGHFGWQFYEQEQNKYIATFIKSKENIQQNYGFAPPIYHVYIFQINNLVFLGS